MGSWIGAWKCSSWFVATFEHCKEDDVFIFIIDLNPSNVTIVVGKIYLKLITKEASIPYVELMSLQIHCLGCKAI